MSFEDVLKNIFNFRIGSCGSSLTIVQVTYNCIQWLANNQINNDLIKNTTTAFIKNLTPENYSIFCYSIDNVESEINDLFNPETNSTLLLSSAGCPQLPNNVSINDAKLLINIIKECIKAKNETDLVADKTNSSIKNLSLGMNQYLTEQEELREKQITEQIRKQNNEFSEWHNKMEKQYSDMEKKMKSLQNKYQNIVAALISILAIFSGVIMVFFGGLKLFDNTMQNLTANNDFKVVFLVALIALVVFNTLVYLLNLIKKTSLGESFETDKQKEGEFEKSFPYFKMINKVIIVIIFLFLVLYLFDIIDISQYIKIFPQIHT